MLIHWATWEGRPEYGALPQHRAQPKDPDTKGPQHLILLISNAQDKPETGSDCRVRSCGENAKGLLMGQVPFKAIKK